MAAITVKQVKNNIMLSVLAQVISLIASLVINLALPKFIDDYNYAYWQTYLLFIGYVGIFHFGILDGIVLRFSHYDYEELSKETMHSLLSAMMLISAIVAALGITLSMVLTKGPTRIIFIMVSIGVMTRNLFNYTSYSFQITNRINRYAIMTISFRCLNVLLVIAMLLSGIGSYVWLCAADLFCDLFGVLVSFRVNKDIYIGKLLGLRDILNQVCLCISSGIMLTLSNWTSFLLSGASRFIISLRWGELTFGKVSFTYSVINLFLVFITAASVVLFPALKRMDKDMLPLVYAKVKRPMTMVLLGIMLGFYPGAYILGLWVPAYTEALRYMGILLPIVIYSTKINLLTNNYLKAQRREKVLLAINLISVTVSILGVCLGAYVFGSFALTLVCSLAGFMLNATLSDIYVSRLLGLQVIKDLCWEYLMTLCFIASSILLGGVVGFCAYLIAYITYVFLNRRMITLS